MTGRIWKKYTMEWKKVRLGQVEACNELKEAFLGSQDDCHES
jgi:hypothetical protein